MFSHHRSVLRFLPILALITILLPGTARALTYTVTTTNDSGAGSLRAAIEAANSNPGADTITFNIPGSGVKTITLSADLPQIGTPMLIDGLTQPGASCGASRQLLIQIDGINTLSAHGLSIFNTVTVRGLSLGNFDLAAIAFLSGGTVGDPSRVECSHIGLSADQATARPNGTGVLVSGAPFVQIGSTISGSGNVISGNIAQGVEIEDADNAAVYGNFIGLKSDGSTVLANGLGGVLVERSTNTLIGGLTTSARNVISGNGPSTTNFSNGIALALGSGGTRIQGNIIGLDATGTQDRRNNGFGINIASDGNFIGNGTEAGANRIGSNRRGGVFVEPIRVNNRISYNAISNNSYLRLIDLNPFGINDNDAGDIDTGANNGQNFPLIDSVQLIMSGTTARLNLTLNSAANMPYRVEVFAGDTCFGYPVILGSLTMTTNGAGNASATFDTPYNPSQSLYAVTAIDPNGNTSEYSPCGAVNLISNPRFDSVGGNGFPTSWGFYALNNDGSVNNNNVSLRVNNGGFEFYRVTGSAQAVLLQNTGLPTAANTRMNLAIRLGNVGNDRRRALVIVHDNDFSDIQACSFWITANSPQGRDYFMNFTTGEAWTNTTVSIYHSNPISNTGWLRVDDVQLSTTGVDAANNGANDEIFCYDPLAPGVLSTVGSDSSNFLNNADFSAWNPQAVGNWTTFGSIVHNSAAGGVFQMYRRPDNFAGEGTGVVFQNTSFTGMSTYVPRVTFDLGNSSPTRRMRVFVLVHNRTFSDLQACTLYVPPNTPLTPYVMTTFPTASWAEGASVSFYTSTRQNTDPGGGLLLDNVSLIAQIGSSRFGTRCERAPIGGGLEAEPLTAPIDLALPTLIPTATPFDAAPTAEETLAPVFEFVLPTPTAIGDVEEGEGK